MSAVPAVPTFNAVDPNGAEGIVADAQVAGELGCRALPVPTGLLVGGENGRPTIEKAPARWLEAAAASSARDGRPAAGRIGLVTGAGQAEAISAVLAQRAVPRVVCAPVARLAGEQILDHAALDTVRRTLQPLSSVVVIRAGDLEAHGGGSPEDLEAARGLAAAIRAGGAASVGLREEYTKRFMLHYNFPPFSVGEFGRMTGVGRREIGHGNLAERALKMVFPGEEIFPYTVRVISDILESNGSSSMATVCAGSLAMMDAGIGISNSVAGIAMGLVKEGDRFAILSDILGNEDHLGDMDFKVAGTTTGITALQMDLKIQGISFEIMEKALQQAKEGRHHILEIMNQAIEKHAEWK